MSPAELSPQLSFAKDHQHPWPLNREVRLAEECMRSLQNSCFRDACGAARIFRIRRSASRSNVPDGIEWITKTRKHETGQGRTDYRCAFSRICFVLGKDRRSRVTPTGLAAIRWNQQIARWAMRLQNCRQSFHRCCRHRCLSSCRPRRFAGRWRPGCPRPFCDDGNAIVANRRATSLNWPL